MAKSTKASTSEPDAPSSSAALGAQVTDYALEQASGPSVQTSAAAPRTGVIADLEGRAKDALAVGDIPAYAALHDLVGAAHHLKSCAGQAIEKLTGDDAQIVKSLLGVL